MKKLTTVKRTDGTEISNQEFWDICKDLIPGDKCPWCEKDILEYTPEDVYSGEGLICPKCFSDYAYYKNENYMVEYNAT